MPTRHLQELDDVTLKQDARVNDLVLPAGLAGTIVCADTGRGDYIVEFSGVEGRNVLASVPFSEVTLIECFTEIAHQS